MTFPIMVGRVHHHLIKLASQIGSQRRGNISFSYNQARLKRISGNIFATQIGQFRLNFHTTN
ncbi:MAG: hypothetical protein EBV03_11825 [Proteobacteria bacterium]|nr:hypothetical protein [Pseudomonadota bacterium]